MAALNANAAQAREYFPRGLFQPEGSFRFSLDALLLAAYVARLRPEWRRLADLGCGCGPVALGALILAKSQPGRAALGLEIQDELLQAARLNAARLGLAGAFRAERADFAHYAPDALAGSFDLVTANPPYRLPGAGRLPPAPARRMALFGGAETLAAFIRAGRELLAPGGAFCLIFPARRQDELVACLAAEGLGAFAAMPVRARAGAVAGKDAGAEAAVAAGAKVGAELLLVAARHCAGENNDLALKMQSPLVLYETDAAGARRLSRAALAFCPFLACNAAG